MKRVIFHNAHHNGDIHVSRELVKIIVNKVRQIDKSIQFIYRHINDPCLLADIDNLSFEPLNPASIDPYANLVHSNGEVYINTWFAQQHHKYMNVYGISLDCLYAALNDSCKSLWDFYIEDVYPEPASYIPNIDYSRFEIAKAEEWLANHPEKKVFIANGLSMSGQAHNFTMTPIIFNIARDYPDTTFILSSQEIKDPLPPNVIYSKDIIQKRTGSDLNENSFLTNHCYLIIGRASGVYSFAWTQSNTLEREAKFLAFCHPGVLTQKSYPFWTHELFHDRIPYTAKFFENDTSSPGEAEQIIRSHLI